MRAAIGLILITALLLLGARGGLPPMRSGVPVTLESAALIGLCYYLSQSAWLAGIAYWTLYRPLVAGLLVGVILGDPWAGASVGAVLNIAFLGFLGTGGALPTGGNAKDRTRNAKMENGFRSAYPDPYLFSGFPFLRSAFCLLRCELCQLT